MEIQTTVEGLLIFLYKKNQTLTRSWPLDEGSNSYILLAIFNPFFGTLNKV